MRYGSIRCLLVAMALTWAATSAHADSITLTNGDVLRGEVRDSGDFLVIDHPVLGRLQIPRSDVEAFDMPHGPAPAPGPATIRAPVTADCGCAFEATPDPCKRPWDFAFGAGLSNDAGNTIKTKLNLDLEIGYRWNRRNSLSWRGTSFYEEANGEQTEGKYTSNLAYKRDLSRRSRFVATQLLSRDDFADILLRTGWFLGYEYDFVKRKRTTFSGGLGAGAGTERRAGFPTLTTSALLAHLAYRHEFEQGDSFLATANAVPYLDEIERSPLQLELRYLHPLRDHLDLTVGFLIDYVPEPPGDFRSYDTKFTFGLRWRP
ncbi:MAG: DUF481 domain-containing protein [Planctomycetota bacterium]|nr:DUF481 domain-containing protein [Planctomycetota bacterium]